MCMYHMLTGTWVDAEMDPERLEKENVLEALKDIWDETGEEILVGFATWISTLATVNKAKTDLVTDAKTALQLLKEMAGLFLL